MIETLALMLVNVQFRIFNSVKENKGLLELTFNWLNDERVIFVYPNLLSISIDELIELNKESWIFNN